MNKYITALVTAIAVVLAADYSKSPTGVLASMGPKTAGGFDWRPFALGTGAVIAIHFVVK